MDDQMGYTTGTSWRMRAEAQDDQVNNPKHYKGNNLEAITVIEDFELGYHLGNAVKYILRAGKKDNRIQDLKKAIWYLERECGEG
jgi:hypothetical protein